MMAAGAFDIFKGAAAYTKDSAMAKAAGGTSGADAAREAAFPSKLNVAADLVKSEYDRNLKEEEKVKAEMAADPSGLTVAERDAMNKFAEEQARTVASHKLGAVKGAADSYAASKPVPAQGTEGRLSANLLIAHERIPMTLTCTNWLAQNPPRYIRLWINPKETQWSLPRREAITKTAAGVMRNTWWNRFRKTYYDEWTVNFTFQTGNIMPSAGVIDPSTALAAPPIPPGLGDLYEFIHLLNQPMLVGQVENRHIIQYHSRLFPDLRLEGYWMGTSPITFNDSAVDGNKTTWTSMFQVYKSYPDIWDYEGLMSKWIEWVKQNASDELMSTPALAAVPFSEGIPGLPFSASGAPSTAQSTSKLTPTSPDVKTPKTLQGTTNVGQQRIVGIVGGTSSASTANSRVNNGANEIVNGKVVPKVVKSSTGVISSSYDRSLSGK